ncbi:MAG: hypothetical protein MHM6MM_005788 [Cercozoa sp. M6MM]
MSETAKSLCFELPADALAQVLDSDVHLEEVMRSAVSLKSQDGAGSFLNSKLLPLILQDCLKEQETRRAKLLKFWRTVVVGLLTVRELTQVIRAVSKQNLPHGRDSDLMVLRLAIKSIFCVCPQTEDAFRALCKVVVSVCSQWLQARRKKLDSNDAMTCTTLTILFSALVSKKNVLEKRDLELEDTSVFAKSVRGTLLFLGSSDENSRETLLQKVVDVASVAETRRNDPTFQELSQRTLRVFRESCLHFAASAQSAPRGCAAALRLCLLRQDFTLVPLLMKNAPASKELTLQATQSFLQSPFRPQTLQALLLAMASETVLCGAVAHCVFSALLADARTKEQTQRLLSKIVDSSVFGDIPKNWTRRNSILSLRALRLLGEMPSLEVSNLARDKQLAAALSRNPDFPYFAASSVSVEDCNSLVAYAQPSRTGEKRLRADADSLPRARAALSVLIGALCAQIEADCRTDSKQIDAICAALKQILQHLAVVDNADSCATFAGLLERVLSHLNPPRKHLETIVSRIRQRAAKV